MAQHKYDVYTVHTSPSRRHQKHFPWYRERLQLKYLDSCRRSGVLDGGKWSFLAADLDDQRSGVPIQLPANAMVTKRMSESVPLINSKRCKRIQVQPRAHCSGQTDQLGTLYSRAGPRNHAQQKHVREVESTLLKHQLALYPCLEAALPPKDLEELVHILDPELHPADGCLESVSSPSPALDEDIQRDLNNTPPPYAATANIYRWPLSQTDEEKLTETTLRASQKVISADQESRVNRVTHDLVQWAKHLGSSDGFDERTIQNLFTSDYDSQPALAAPIHVVELMNVPAELRLESREATGHSASGWRQRVVLGTEDDRPRTVRCRYGAWYLPINLWRKSGLNEPLQDPNKETTRTDSEAVARSNTMDQLLSELHSARAFRDFIATHKPGTTLPKGLPVRSHPDGRKRTFHVS